MNILLVIDMLNDFIAEKGALFCGNKARKIIPFIKKRIVESRKFGNQIIYICDSHPADDKEFKMFSPHCIKGTRGAKIIDELSPEIQDIIIKKTCFNAFYDTDLEKVLRELDPKTIFITGVCTSICVMDTVGGLRNRDYKVTIYRNGTADFDTDAYEFALKRMNLIYGADIE